MGGGPPPRKGELLPGHQTWDLDAHSIRQVGYEVVIGHVAIDAKKCAGLLGMNDESAVLVRTPKLDGLSTSDLSGNLLLVGRLLESPGGDVAQVAPDSFRAVLTPRKAHAYTPLFDSSEVTRRAAGTLTPGPMGRVTLAADQLRPGRSGTTSDSKEAVSTASRPAWPVWPAWRAELLVAGNERVSPGARGPGSAIRSRD